MARFQPPVDVGLSNLSLPGRPPIYIGVQVPHDGKRRIDEDFVFRNDWCLEINVRRVCHFASLIDYLARASQMYAGQVSRGTTTTTRRSLNAANTALGQRLGGTTGCP